MQMIHRMMRMTLILAAVLATAPLRADSANWSYPATRAVDVIDDYHGTTVADPYRWLEDPDAPETAAFVAEQNRLARAFVDSPLRERIKARLTELWDYPRYSAPTRRGETYFFTRNDGLQPQAVLYQQAGLKGPPRVLIDPNALSEDGTVSLSGTTYSDDGSLLAYGVSVAGSDQRTIRVRSVAEGRELDDELKWCKFSGIAWKKDNSGFFYNRFPTPGTVPPEDEAFYNRLYWHALGTPQDQDPVVYEDPADKALSFSPSITDDGKYLVLHVSRGSTPVNRVYVREVDSDGPFNKLIDADLARFRLVGNDGAVFYFNTNLDAPKGRVIAIDLNDPAPQNWKTLIAETDEPIRSVQMVNDQFVISYLRDAHHVLKIFNRDGGFAGDIGLPTVGTVNVSGRREDREMFVTFTSMTFPSTIFRYDFAEERLSLYRQNEVQFDPDRYETTQLFAKSRDGTRLPVFVAHRKGLKLDGTNPTILYGYGGFNAGQGPNFSVSRIAWLEQGGVAAVAVLRGGNEYGREWHEAGRLGNKQNVFDDFIAIGEFLCEQGYTSSAKLAIQGGSNGGLLTAACMIQRPDLFGAVISNVPVTDMLRYHRFTVGRFWIPEYGNAEAEPEHFKFLHAYSPLHNVAEGAVYPPILVTTAEGDDRVVPAHAFKFVAALQSRASGANPILLLTQTKAGHGGGKPVYKVIDETADQYAFLARVFGMKWDAAPKSD